MTSRALAAAAALALWAVNVPVAAFAQSDADVPSYARPVDTVETIHGRIASIDGNHLVVHDDRGFDDNIQLGDDTSIDPPGARLLPGMTVRVVGANRGDHLAARHIDLPRQTAGPLPLPPGSELNGVIETQLDSKSAYVGEDVLVDHVNSTDGVVTDATLHGTVSNVVTAGQGRNAQIGLHFDTLTLRDGSVFPVDGVVESMQVNTKNNALKEAGGALAGMLAGNAIAKTLLGVSGGGLIGAVGGFLIAKDNRSDVVIPAQTAVTVRLAPQRRQPG
jgi:hypothetical protein